MPDVAGSNSDGGYGAGDIGAGGFGGGDPGIGPDTLGLGGMSLDNPYSGLNDQMTALAAGLRDVSPAQAVLDGMVNVAVDIARGAAAAVYDATVNVGQVAPGIYDTAAVGIGLAGGPNEGRLFLPRPEVYAGAEGGGTG